MKEIETIIKNTLSQAVDDDVITVVLMHHTILELMDHIMKYEGENSKPPPLLDDLLTICANRVREFYRQRDIKTGKTTTLQ